MEDGLPRATFSIEINSDLPVGITMVENLNVSSPNTLQNAIPIDIATFLERYDNSEIGSLCNFLFASTVQIILCYCVIAITYITYVIIINLMRMDKE